MAREFMYVGGTGEKPDRNQFLFNGLKRFHQPGDVHTFISYPASIGPANLTPNPVDFQQSALQSRVEGERLLAAAIERTNNVPILCGYSLGAWVVSNFLENMTTGRYPRLQVAGAVLAGNPRRAASTGEGIAGRHENWPGQVPVVDLSNYYDIICNTPKGSVLRKLPYVGDVLTNNLDTQTREAWRRLAQEWFWGRWVFPTRLDYELLRKYLDGSGHGSEYFTNDLWKHAGKGLGGIL